jgi:hypothetical protein
MPAGELTVKLSEEEAEKRLSDETAEEGVCSRVAS